MQINIGPDDIDEASRKQWVRDAVEHEARKGLVTWTAALGRTLLMFGRKRPPYHVELFGPGRVGLRDVVYCVTYLWFLDQLTDD